LVAQLFSPPPVSRCRTTGLCAIMIIPIDRRPKSRSKSSCCHSHQGKNFPHWIFCSRSSLTHPKQLQQKCCLEVISFLDCSSRLDRNRRHPQNENEDFIPQHGQSSRARHQRSNKALRSRQHSLIKTEFAVHLDAGSHSPSSPGGGW
jgi:hypothetical protein